MAREPWTSKSGKLESSVTFLATMNRGCGASPQEGGPDASSGLSSAQRGAAFLGADQKDVSPQKST
jgi:hypothetical protein